MSGDPSSMMGAIPPGDGASPPAGGGPPQPQATGASPATMPAPNRGLEAAALAKLAVYVQGMSVLLAVLPAGSDVARDVREAINKIAKHVPPGAVSQGLQMTEAQKNLLQQRQMGPQIAAMRGAQTGQMPGAPPGAGSPPPPMAT